MLEFDGKRLPITFLLLLFVAVGVDGIFGEEPPEGDAMPISSISSIGCGGVACVFVRSIVTTSFGGGGGEGVDGSGLLTCDAGVYCPTLLILLFLRLPPHLAYSQ